MWGCLCLLYDDLVDSNMKLRWGLALSSRVLATVRVEALMLPYQRSVQRRYYLPADWSVCLPFQKTKNMILLWEYERRFHAGYRPLVVNDCFAAITELVHAFGAFTEFCSIEGPVRRLSVSCGGNEFEAWRKPFS